VILDRHVAVKQCHGVKFHHASRVQSRRDCTL